MIISEKSIFDLSDITDQMICFISEKYSDGSNNVRSSMFDRSKPKIGCSSSIINR